MMPFSVLRIYYRWMNSAIVIKLSIASALRITPIKVISYITALSLLCNKFWFVFYVFIFLVAVGLLLALLFIFSTCYLFIRLSSFMFYVLAFIFDGIIQCTRSHSRASILFIFLLSISWYLFGFSLSLPGEFMWVAFLWH